MLDRVQVKILNSMVDELPSYATSGSAGLDLRAAIHKNIELNANKTILIPTGLSIFIEDKNYAAALLPRSGLGHKKGIVLGNLVGLIDSDYQGELMISCWNRSNENYMIEPLDRIAQLVFIKIEHPKLEIVHEFKSSERGNKGFGSSGKK